ncbi:unnamed protein product [Microthlaspi erraticum]|uniref:Myb-like domain-containing protein n=1 Tax=Microthlaspi erraticum TaxID=1685480 RepID=A0A6D2L2V1_9BRAS|nr:unnamed protein product [Microthlaspi erraticum]
MQASTWASQPKFDRCCSLWEKSDIRESHEKTTIISFLLQKPLSDVESYYQKKQQSAPIIGNEIVLVAPQAPTIINQGQWSQAENALLLEGMKKCPKKNGRIDWAGIASGFVKSRTARQAKDRGRSYIEKQKKNP